MKPPRGMVIDHIDGNGLNNCRSNLRICTQRQNNYNKRGKRRFTGVRRYREGSKYAARIIKDGKNYYIGSFDDPIEAAKARDRKALELHGEFAHLSFPDEADPPETDG
jgi:hypothetical protein